MSPTFVVYIGFVVAVVILVWGVLELSQRWEGRRRMRHQAMNTWVPLNPTVVDRNTTEDRLADEDSDEETAPPDSHSRAQQNGHYSESKKTL